ncbi:hypothetical protein CWI66_12305, partial [Halomonas sp. 141]
MGHAIFSLSGFYNVHYLRCGLASPFSTAAPAIFLPARRLLYPSTLVNYFQFIEFIAIKKADLLRRRLLVKRRSCLQLALQLRQDLEQIPHQAVVGYLEDR